MISVVDFKRDMIVSSIPQRHQNGPYLLLSISLTSLLTVCGMLACTVGFSLRLCQAPQNVHILLSALVFLGVVYGTCIVIFILLWVLVFFVLKRHRLMTQASSKADTEVQRPLEDPQPRTHVQPLPIGNIGRGPAWGQMVGKGPGWVPLGHW